MKRSADAPDYHGLPTPQSTLRDRSDPRVLTKPQPTACPPVHRNDECGQLLSAGVDAFPVG